MSKAKTKLLRSIVAECNPFVDAFLEKSGPMLKAAIENLDEPARVHDLYECFRHCKHIRASLDTIEAKCPAEVSEYQPLTDFEDFLMKLEREERHLVTWDKELPHIGTLAELGRGLESKIDLWNKINEDAVAPVAAEPPPVGPIEPSFEEALKEASSEGTSGEVPVGEPKK